MAKITAVQSYQTSDGNLHTDRKEAETAQFWIDFQSEMREALKGTDRNQTEQMVKFLCLVEPIAVRDVLSKFISKAKASKNQMILTQLGIAESVKA